jgi:lipoteichoic acid synthase
VPGTDLPGDEAAHPAPTSPRLRRIRLAVGWVALSFVLFGSAAATVLRAGFLDKTETQNLGQPAGSVLPVVVADAPLVGVILCLGIGGWLLPARGRRRWLAVAARILAIVLFLVQVIDVALFRAFFMRFDLADVALYGREVEAGTTLAVGLSRLLGSDLPPAVLGAAVSAVLLCWLAALLTCPFPRRAPRALVWGASGLLLFSAATAAVPADTTRLHGWAYRNVISANLPKTIVTPYSAAYLAEAVRLRVPTRVLPGRNLRLNVVVYVVESLSSKQSAAFGGLHDLTPELDTLATRGLAVPGFLANGLNTNQGLVALLTGRVPLPSVGSGLGDGLAGFLEGPSLARSLAAHGYLTEFLTASDLGFTRKDEWLARVGFESIRGSRDPAFDGWPRFVFDSAPDEALVNEVAAREKRLRDASDRPFLLVAETATSHMPFVHPNGRDHGEAGVIRYVDREIGRLARLLEESGFFASGLLVVTSDHRTMSPLEAGEPERFGLSAFTRVPFVAVGAGIVPGRPDAPFQQADLPGSLLCLLTPECPVSPTRGSLFDAPPRPPRYVVSLTGNDRALVYVRHGQEEAVVRLDGEASRAVRGRLSPEVEDEILREIALVRVENEPLPWPPADR